MQSFLEQRKLPKPQSSISVLIVGLLIVAFLIVLSFQWRSKQRVKHVDVEGNVLLEKEEVLNVSQLHLDSLKMSDLNFKEITRRIEEHPFVKIASIMSNGSETLVIKIIERKPIARMITTHGDVRFIDAEATILPYRLTVLNLDIPLISGIAVKDAADSSYLREAVRLIQKIESTDEKLYKAISEIQADSDGRFRIITTENALPIYFGSTDELTAKIEKIKLFWNTQLFKIGAMNLRYIDVRWNGQIVVQITKNE